MTDSTSSTALREAALDKAAVTGTDSSIIPTTDPSRIPTGGSDNAVMTDVAQAEAEAEACIRKNKGMIVDFLNNLPAPLLAILKSLAHIALIPLHVIESLPLGSIYTNLNNFANGNSCQPPLPTSASDCVPPQGM